MKQNPDSSDPHDPKTIETFDTIEADDAKVPLVQLDCINQYDSKRYGNTYKEACTNFCFSP
jgi:hypothetical protein